VWLERKIDRASIRPVRMTRHSETDRSSAVRSLEFWEVGQIGTDRHFAVGAPAVARQAAYNRTRARLDTLAVLIKCTQLTARHTPVIPVLGLSLRVDRTWEDWGRDCRRARYSQGGPGDAGTRLLRVDNRGDLPPQGRDAVLHDVPDKL